MIGTLSTLLPTSSRIGGSADASRAALRVVVELVPVETVAFWEAVGLHQPVGLLKEILQGLRGIRPTKPSLPVQQQTVQHPPDQLCLGDPELPRRRLQCPLVLVAYVQLLPDLNKSRSRIRLGGNR